MVYKVNEIKIRIKDGTWNDTVDVKKEHVP